MTDDFHLSALRTHPNNDSNLADHPQYPNIKNWLPKTWEAREKKFETVRDSERSSLLDQIYDGQLWAIGCRTLADGNDEFVRVPRQHFFTDYDGERDTRPRIYWSKGELAVGTDSYFDIHVVRAPGDTRKDEPVNIPEGDAAEDDVAHVPETSDGNLESIPAASTSVDGNVDPHPRRKSGRPSEAEVILAAIAAHAVGDPKLKRPRRVRYLAYKSYISEQGYDPDSDAGFSEKTLQKYETTFRKTNR